jgi:hypothetical protein
MYGIYLEDSGPSLIGTWNHGEDSRAPVSLRPGFTGKITGCRRLVVVLSLSKREVVSSSPAHAGCVKPKTFRIGSDCSFAKNTAFGSENQGSFEYDLKNGGLVSQ